MRSPDRRLERILAAARKAPPEPTPETSPAKIQYFSNRLLAAWAKTDPASAPTDPLWLWERVGAWSLGAAVATLVLIFSLCHAPKEANAFDPFEPDRGEELLFFAAMQ